MTINWPASLKARSMNPHPRGLSRSGGRSINGSEQRVASDAGYWALTVSGMVIRSRETAAAYRSLIARLRMSEPVIVPVCDLYRPVGSGLGSSEIWVASNAALRATTLALAVSGIDVQAGHHLTIDGRLYLITEVIYGPTIAPLENRLVLDEPWADNVPWTDAASAAATYQVKVFPPMRAAVASGTAVSFRNLTMIARLEDMASGDLDLDLGRFGTPSLSLIEYF
jgi:hypothetical protein